MKKLLSVLLILCIMLGLNPMLAEEINEEAPEYLTSIAGIDSKIYASGFKSIYEYNQETKELIKKKSYYEKFSGWDFRIFSISDELYFISLPEIYKVNTDDFSLSDYKTLDIQSDKSYILEVIDTGDDLAIIYSNYEQELSVLWLNSGKSVSIGNQYFTSYAPYKDGAIVAFSGEKKLFIIDQSSSKELYDFSKLPDSYYNATVAYDKASDSLYMIADNKLWTVNDKFELTEKTFLPVMPRHGGSAIFLPDNKIAYIGINYNGSTAKINVYNYTDNTYKDRIIKVFGLADHFVKEYNAMDKEFLIEQNGGNYLDRRDSVLIANDMKSNDASDIYLLINPSSRDEFVKLDYAADFNSSQVLMDNASRYYSYIHDVAFEGDKLIYIPFDMSIDNVSLAYNIKEFEELGFTEADVPKTYAQFIDFLLEAQIRTENSDIKLMNNSKEFPIKEVLTMGIIGDEYAKSIMENRQFSINNPNMMQLLSKVNDADLYMFGSVQEQPDVVYEMESEESHSLLVMDYDGMNIDDNKNQIYLSLGENSKPIKPARVRGFILNSLSNNKEKAIKLIEDLLELIEARNQAMFYSDINEGIIDSSMSKSIEGRKKQIEILKKKLDTADDKEKKALKEEINNYEDSLKYMVQYKYAVNKHAIDSYKANIDSYYALRRELFDFKNDQMNKLINQYMTKNIDLNAFISELERIARMSDLENK